MFRGAYENVWYAKGMQGLGRCFGAREVSDNLNDVRVKFSWVDEIFVGIWLAVWLIVIT